MAQKKRLTVKEAKLAFPEAFQDATGAPDKRIDEQMAEHITHHLNEGETPFDAKLKALCVSKPPDHYRQISPAGQWPKLMYHADGRTKTVEDQEELDALNKEKGWSTKASKIHLDKFQRGSTTADENIRRLQRELNAELKAKQELQEAQPTA
jgi:hypothetical protein